MCQFGGLFLLVAAFAARFFLIPAGALEAGLDSDIATVGCGGKIDAAGARAVIFPLAFAVVATGGGDGGGCVVAGKF